MPHKTITVTPGRDLIDATRVDHRGSEVKYEFLREAVGGPIETVPHLTSVVVDGKKLRCVAYCNEEGLLRGLPINRAATQAWLDVLGPGPFRYDPQLFGSIVFVINANQFRE